MMYPPGWPIPLPPKKVHIPPHAEVTFIAILLRRNNESCVKNQATSPVKRQRTPWQDCISPMLKAYAQTSTLQTCLVNSRATGKQAIPEFNSLGDFTLRTSSLSQRAGFTGFTQPSVLTLTSLLARGKKKCFLNIDFLNHCQGHAVSHEPHLSLPASTDLNSAACQEASPGQ